MPKGKAAGERCVHLDEANLCRLFADPRRPAFCLAFQAEPAFCGHDRVQALRRLTDLEALTAPVGATYEKDGALPMEGDR